MSEAEERIRAPMTDDIERRFRHPVVLAARPAILGGLGVLRFVRRFGWTAEGREVLAEWTGPLIFAANHLSHADTAAILGTLPAQLRRRTCVAAALDVFGPANSAQTSTIKSLRRECLQTIVAAGFHAFAFDRHGPPLRSIRTAVELIRRGWSLLLFPEGTRSRGGTMGPFKPGVGVIAKTTAHPVVPIHVSGGNVILPCGGSLPGPGHAIVRYGEPLMLRSGESAVDFTERLRARVHALAPGSERLTLSEQSEQSEQPPLARATPSDAHQKQPA